MSAGVQAAPLRAWIFPFTIAAVAWGSSFLFIELALQSFSPSHVAFGRVAVGALVLMGMVIAARHIPRFTWRDVAAVGLIAVCLSGAPFILIPWAQQSITSILASLLNATVPLWTALFVALWIPTERATRTQVVGLLIGVLGIAVLLGAWNVENFPLLGAVLMLSATAFYGVGSTLSRMLLTRVKESHTSVSALQVSLSALFLAPFALAAGSPGEGAFDISGWALWGLVLLGALGTSFAYVMFWRVIAVAGATAGASVTYVVPIVATILGIAILGEELLWYEPVGAVIVLLGVWLSGRRPSATNT